MSTGVEVIGWQEAQKRLTKLADELYDAEDQRLFTVAARAIADSARQKAPKSDRIRLRGARGRAFKEWHTPGRLRKAIIAGGWRQSADARRRYGPGAYAQVNLKSAYRNTAPYGAIVEKGRSSWRPFAGRNYFRSSVQQVGPRELNRIANAYKSLIERRYR